MASKETPSYMNKHSNQTLEEGLREYYLFNPQVTDPSTQPLEFKEILRAHDIGHVIYACDTSMRDELKILPLFWWTSECTFREYLKMKNSPAVDIMYKDMIAEKGELHLLITIAKAAPKALIDIAKIWLRSRKRSNRLPFLKYHSLMDQKLTDIRRTYQLMNLIP